MIFIVDNMRQYSDHALHFVQFDFPSPISVEDASLAVLFVHEAHNLWDRAIIIGVADRIDWREGGSSAVLTANDLRQAVREWNSKYMDDDDRDRFRDHYLATIKVLSAMIPGYDPSDDA